MKHNHLESEIIQSLDAYTNQLDSATTAGLRNARRNALLSSNRSSYPVWLNWAGATGFAVIVLLMAVSVFHVNQHSMSTPLLDDLDLLVSEELDFYQDFEVIQWMVANDIEFDS